MFTSSAFHGTDGALLLVPLRASPKRKANMCKKGGQLPSHPSLKSTLQFKLADFTLQLHSHLGQAIRSVGNLHYAGTLLFSSC